MLPRQDAPLCVAKVLHAARDLASGLAKLHAAGFLHCDISGGKKPLIAFQSDLAFLF